MNPLLVAKRIAEASPEPMAKLLRFVPFSWRLGPEYQHATDEIARFDRLSPAERRKMIAGKLQRIVAYAYSNIPFYRRLYSSRSFHPSQLRELADFSRVPIIDRALLQAAPLRERSAFRLGRMLLNTGGTSGQPLAFFVDGNAFAREWAHMHRLWGRAGYSSRALKLTLRGRNLRGKALVYNPVHNELVANSYLPVETIASSLLARSDLSEISFIHGYPSLVYSFALACRSHFPGLLSSLKASLRGVLLGSEYPAPQYRAVVEETFGVPSLSWYGHSEMCVLAGELERFVYQPLQTYGYTEAIQIGTGSPHLVGTTYSNLAAPLIRYDTGDLIEPMRVEEGLLATFRVTEGRVGDFILDANGHPVALTALVFGRHHRVFEWARFIQLQQSKAGEATVYLTCDTHGHSAEDAERDFDTSGTPIRFTFVLRDAPFRTHAGKIPLLLPSLSALGNSSIGEA